MGFMVSVPLGNGDCSAAIFGCALTSLNQDKRMHVDIVAVTNTLVLEKGPIGKNLFDCFYDAFEAKGMSHRLQSLHDWE